MSHNPSNIGPSVSPAADRDELPYIGSKISLISSSDIRYEGTLDSINPAESTVTLRFVRSFGTEDRPVSVPVPPSPAVYECIAFHGKHIKDLTVCSEPEYVPEATPNYPVDPAIASLRANANLVENESYNNDKNREPFIKVSENKESLPKKEVKKVEASKYGDPATVGGGTIYPNYPMDDPGQYKRGRGGRRMRKDHHTHTKRNVGVLESCPNMELKSQVEKDFDFETMNEKFNKSEETKTPTSNVTVNDNNVIKGYDRASSFFDSISCEALEKATNKDHPDPEEERKNREALRQQQRLLDIDTFGESAANFSVRNFSMNRGSRGRRRGMRGGGRNRPHSHRHNADFMYSKNTGRMPKQENTVTAA